MTAKEPMPSTRRALLGAALGGAAAVAAASLRPLDVRAADGENALLGLANQASAPTIIENTDAGEASLVGLHASAGVGVLGDSSGGVGVHGASDTKSGVLGTSDEQAGVWASSGDAALASVRQLPPGTSAGRCQARVGRSRRRKRRRTISQLIRR